MVHSSGPYFSPSQSTRALPSRSTKRSTGVPQFDVALGISSPAPSADQSTENSRGQSFTTTSRATPAGKERNRIRSSRSPYGIMANSEPSGERLQFTPPTPDILAISALFPRSGSKEKNVVVASATVLNKHNLDGIRAHCR